MSISAKGTTLRLIVPKDAESTIIASLGNSSKVETKSTVLSADEMTTDEIVARIKDYARLRDELFHTIRQLGLPRDPKLATSEVGDFSGSLSEARKKLEDEKTTYTEIQTRIDELAKRIDEARKQAGRISDIVQAGFSSADVTFAKGEFNRVIGRIPARKLEDTQRALQKLLGDQAVLAPGNRIKDSVFVLVAAPEEKMPQVLQALLLNDFTQTEIPKSDEPDLKQAQSTLEARMKELTQELEASKGEMKSFQDQANEILNRLADTAQSALILLQAVLRMGDGSTASMIFAQLPKPLTPKILSSLSSQGALVEAE